MSLLFIAKKREGVGGGKAIGETQLLLAQVIVDMNHLFFFQFQTFARGHRMQHCSSKLLVFGGLFF